MKYLEKAEEYSKILKKDLVLVDFFATWCGPCRLLSKEIESLAKKRPDLEIVKVDIDKFPDIADKNHIMVVPTMKIYKKGNEVNSHSGYIAEEEIESLLS